MRHPAVPHVTFEVEYFRGRAHEAQIEIRVRGEREAGVMAEARLAAAVNDDGLPRARRERFDGLDVRGRDARAGNAQHADARQRGN